MKATCLYFIIFTLFCSNILPAQQARVVLPLPHTVQLQGRAVESETQPGAVQPVTNQLSTPSYSQFELLDLTGDSLVLGYIPLSTGGNERQAIMTPIGKSDWLRSTIADDATRAFSERATPVLYVLNDISTGRTRSGNYVRLKATVYESGAAGYSLLGKVDTLVTDNAGDISSIGDLINLAIGSTAALLNGGIVQNPSAKALTREEVILHQKQEYAFISTGVNPTGIYMSYDEYKSGKPSFGQFFIETDTTAKTIKVNSFTQTDSTLRPVIPWAIAVNNELYVYKDNRLYPVEAIGSNLLFSRFIDPDTRKNNGSFWSITVGSRLSGNYHNIFDNVNTLSLSNYHGRGLSGEAVKLNSDTGTPEF